MKFSVIVVWFLFCTHATQAQVKVTGYVKHQNKPVSDATVSLKSTVGDGILYYEKTEPSGYFSFNLPNVSSDNYLEVSHISFETQKQAISLQNDHHYMIQMEPRKTELPEVKVNTRKLTLGQQKDTINYFITKLTNYQDRVLKDALQKLPGITVNENGQILYQNKAINKFYIDGTDILEDRYNIATNNLPIESIEKIQVLENHQPIKMLDSIVPSDRAAINIKLNDRARHKLLGTVLTGVGADKALLHNNQATLFKFYGKTKLITLFKENNIGLNLQKEIESLNTQFSTELMESNSIKQLYVDFVNIRTPPFKESRYYFNKDILQTNNFLRRFKSGLELKGLAGLAITEFRQLNVAVNIYNFPGDTILLTESTQNKRNQNNYFANLIVEKNTSKLFFKNNFNVKLQRENGSSEVENPLLIRQQLSLPFKYASNNFSLIKYLGGKQLRVNSFSSFTDQTQELYINHGVFQKIINSDLPYNSIKQNLNLRSFYTKLSAGTSFQIGKMNLFSTAGFKIESQTHSTFLQKQPDSVSGFTTMAYPFVNYTDFRRSTFFVDNNLHYYSGKLLFTVGNTFHLQFGKFDSLNATNTIRNRNVFFNNALSLQFKLSSKISLTAAYNFQQVFGTPSAFRNGFFLENYRMITRTGISPLEEQANAIYSTDLAYKNILRSFFMNCILSYTRSLSNIISGSNIGDNGTFYKNILAFQNVSHYRLISINSSKYIGQDKVSLSSNLSFSNIDLNILQAGKLRLVRNNTLHVSAKAQKDFSGVINIAYEFKTRTTHNYILPGRKRSAIAYKTFNQFLRLSGKYKKLVAELSFEHYYNNIPLPQSNIFMDMNFYTLLKNKKTRIFVDVFNVFDNRRLATTDFAESNIFTVTNMLRPFNITTGVKFSF